MKENNKNFGILILFAFILYLPLSYWLSFGQYVFIALTNSAVLVWYSVVITHRKNKIIKILKELLVNRDLIIEKHLCKKCNKLALNYLYGKENEHRKAIL